MTNIENFRDNLQQLIQEQNELKLFGYMETNIMDFFSSPDIFGVYQIVRTINVTASISPLPKLIKAWLAFLCGDNATLAVIMKILNDMDLGGTQAYSMFCSLKAISGWNASLSEREQYASLSVDVLAKEDKSFYMANAQLTYGQMLASQDKFRLSAGAFAKAYDLFDFNKMEFPAVVARVNELLNRCKLGEFASVIDICQNLLIMSARFRAEKENVWDVLHLPLGICYYELNKPHLAIKHLHIAKENIEQLKLFHMHGLIELYLFKSCYTLQDQVGLDKIYADAKGIYEPMHDRMGEILLSTFHLLSSLEEDHSVTQSNIQQLEMIYETMKEHTPTLAIQILVFLKSKGLSSIITKFTINKHLERLRYIGYIPDLQLSLVLYANLLQSENNDIMAISCLQEAVKIHKEYGISAAINFASSPILLHLKKIDPILWQVFSKMSKAENAVDACLLLSNREKEIMQLIAKGKTNEDVSKLLFIGVGTVKWHINHIFSKLQVSNRVQAIEKAKALGEITNLGSL